MAQETRDSLERWTTGELLQKLRHPLTSYEERRSIIAVLAKRGLTPYVDYDPDRPYLDREILKTLSLAVEKIMSASRKDADLQKELSDIISGSKNFSSLSLDEIQQILQIYRRFNSRKR